MAVLTIGDRFPAYELIAIVPGNLKEVEASGPEDYFTTTSSQVPAGTWRVIFFWSEDFTFACPIGATAFGDLYQDFKDRNCKVVGVSVDNEYTHYAWCRNHDKLRNLPFPMASSLNRELTEALGIKRAIGETDRVTFIVGPHNVIQSIFVTIGSVGRNTEEILRQLDTLQLGELYACGWQADAATIDALGQMGWRATVLPPTLHHLNDDETRTHEH